MGEQVPQPRSSIIKEPSQIQSNTNELIPPKPAQTPINYENTPSPMEYENNLPPLPTKYSHPNSETLTSFFSNRNKKNQRQNRKNDLINKKK